MSYHEVIAQNVELRAKLVSMESEVARLRNDNTRMMDTMRRSGMITEGVVEIIEFYE